MSDLVKELRRAAAMDFDAFAETDAELQRLQKARKAARLVVESIPPGTGRRGGQARARWQTKSEAVDRRLRDLHTTWEAARSAWRTP